MFSLSVLVTPWTAACQASLSFITSQILFKLMSIETVIPSNPLVSVVPFSSSLQSFPASGCFQDSVLRIRWPKYRSFSFNISPSNEHSGMISFRIDWLDLLAVQGTLKSSPTSQFKSFSSLVLSLLYGLTLTSIHDYTGKTMALTMQTFVAKVMSLLFNMLSRLVITFLPRSKCLLISWLQ